MSAIRDRGGQPEQATGVEQVNKTPSQMDDLTQQNSQLVEENAATAKALEEQSIAMNERVAYFQLDAASMAGSEPRATRGVPMPTAPKRLSAA